MRKDTIKVAIQGEKASFHEIAAMEYYEQPIELIYCRSFEDVFSMLRKDEVNKALVAVSNSNHGEIAEVKMLLKSNDILTDGEHTLAIRQHIIGLHGTDITNVKKIISHPVALSQCSEYLARQFTNVALEEYYDTSAAVALIKQLADPLFVAIGSHRAAELYGLEVLCRAVQDDPNNITVFKSLSKKKQPE